MTTPIPGTGIAVVTDRTWSLRVFYQLLNGITQESRHLDGIWTTEDLSFSPVDDSPLAAITYNAGKEIRVYFLDTDYVVQEFCYSDGKGWYRGEIGKQGAKASPASGLAAIAYGSDVLGAGEKGVHIRVYYQEASSNDIAELANDGYWHAGELRIADALGATKLAAVAYYFQNQTQIRVYYQDRGLYIKEHGHNDSGWFKGALNAGQITAHSPIAAVVFGDVQLQVYYRDTRGRVVFVKNTGAWSGANVIEGIGPGYNFAVLQWESGRYLRLYYQTFGGAIAEQCSDNSGQSWFPGNLKVEGKS
jgi:hypothetical protein